MMGLFDFFFGNKRDTAVLVLNDRVWLSQNAKINGIKQQIRQQTDSAAILLVAHFEETLQQLFVGEFVEKMLESPGMKEDEPIESQIVSRRIRTAQQKNEERAFGNSRAFSAAEWLESNMPKS